jgi:hypothetical protein
LVAGTLRGVRKAILVVVAAALAFGAWSVFRAGGTVATVAGWLGPDCPGVTIESVHLPMPTDFESAERHFTDAAREVKFIVCEGLGGSIFYYRFASTGARLRAEMADPDWYRSAVSCSKGAVLLRDNLLVTGGLTIKYCQRLHFQIERPHGA